MLCFSLIFTFVIFSVSWQLNFLWQVFYRETGELLDCSIQILLDFVFFIQHSLLVEFSYQSVEYSFLIQTRVVVIQYQLNCFHSNPKNFRVQFCSFESLLNIQFSFSIYCYINRILLRIILSFFGINVENTLLFLSLQPPTFASIVFFQRHYLVYPF